MMRSTFTRRILVGQRVRRFANTANNPLDDKDPSSLSSSEHYYSQQYTLRTNIPETNQAYQGRLEIRKTPVGWGLFALRDYAVGDWVMSTHVLDTTPQADMHTIQLDRHTHAHIDMPARLVNHYCSQANVGVMMRSSEVVEPTTTTTILKTRSIDGLDKNNEKQHTLDFLAIHPIQNEQELFFDYETTEFELSSPFDCSCGSPDCRGKLTGFRYHGDQVMTAYQERFIAPYLIEWFHNNKKS